jgi:hypothetical protein
MVRCSVIMEGCSDGYPQVNSINPSITSTTNMSLTSFSPPEVLTMSIFSCIC